jgi:GTP cyclohydrolase II
MQEIIVMLQELLQELGITSLHLITNNPKKLIPFEKYGIKIVSRVPLHVGRTPFNEYYRQTKEKKLGHFKEGAAECVKDT